MFLAFGIASLVLAVISIFVPGVGIMIAGLSGFMAWMSIGKGLPFGAAAVILNFINIIFLSPGYLLAVGIEASLRTPEQADLFRIWASVLFVQIAAVVIFIANFTIDKVLDYRQKRKRPTSAVFEKPPVGRESWLSNEENRLNPLTSNIHPTETTTERDTGDIPQVTKVLIHKIHGGRKKDSKFWSLDNDLGGGDVSSIPIQIPHGYAGTKRLPKAFQASLYPIVTLVIVVAVLIIARPDLFPFFEYHTIYNTISPTPPRNNNATGKETSVPNITERPVPDRSYQEQTQPSPIRSQSPPKISSTSQNVTTKNIHRISTTGKVFSWRDQEGKLFFSNTNFPLDNETLQVQTEINTYHKVTKVNIVGNQIFVPVTIGNSGREVKLNMLLDTGCSQTTIPLKYLDRISPTYTGTVTSTLADGSKAYGKKAVIDFIKVGSKRENEVTVTGQKIAGSSNSGLLGFDFLKSNSFKIDFENRFIVWM